MRLEHPIFHGPLVTGVQFTKVETPEAYRTYPDGRNLPDKIATWRVQGGKSAKTVDVGLVADPLGFEDSPDAEWISSGINSKGPRSVALGRHGNMFLWGFSGDPSVMTESGKRVFLNTICYMKQFDGHKPLVERVQSSREWVLLHIEYVRKYDDVAEKRDWLRGLFPETVLDRLGLDADALEAYYRKNLDYLFPKKRGFDIDPDLTALGIPARDAAFLNRLVELFAADPKDALALRLFERYIGRDRVPTPEGLKGWVEENKEYLFFSDIGGFRWFVDEYGRADAAITQEASGTTDAGE